MPTLPRRRLAIIPLCALLLAGCEMLGIEDPAKIEAARDAEGRAIGGACRHSGRALEDCYKLNGRASKAAIYAGWRDMDAYMRENNIAVIQSGAAAAKAAPSHAEPEKPAAAEPAAGKKTHAQPDESAPPPRGKTI